MKKRVFAMLAAGLICLTAGCGDDHQVNVSGVATRPAGSNTVVEANGERPSSETTAETVEKTSEAETEAADTTASTEATEAEEKTSSSTEAGSGNSGTGSGSGSTTSTESGSSTISGSVNGSSGSTSGEPLTVSDGPVLFAFADQSGYSYDLDYMYEDFEDFDYEFKKESSDNITNKLDGVSVVVLQPSSDAALTAALSEAEKKKVPIVVYGHAPVKTNAKAWFVAYDPSVTGDKDLTWGQKDEEAILKDFIDGKIKSIVFKDPDYFIEVAEDVTMGIVDGETPDGDYPADLDWDADCTYQTNVANAYIIKPIVITKNNYETELIDEGYYEEDGNGYLINEYDL
jgi:hypothetical protein